MDPNQTDDGESRTTILPSGIVESRNYDPHTKSQQISAEIQAFVSGNHLISDDGGGSKSSTSHSEFRTFFTIWMFVTRLPSPSWIDLHPGYLMRGMCYFPVAGSILGSMYAIIFDCLHVSLGLPASVAASVTVAFGLYITGCFHEDGLADSADGMGGGWSRSQVLRIMTDSRVGTFGCAALSLFLFTKVQLLSSLGISIWNASSSGAGPAILVAQTLSRLSAPYLIRTRDYVAEVGPKSPFYLFMVEAKHIVTWPRVFVAILYSFVVAASLYGWALATVLIVAVLSMAHVAGAKGEYLLGGVMGDFLGATICVCEILVLILIVSRDSIIEIYRLITETMLHSDGSFGIPSFYQQILILYCQDRVRPLFHSLLLLVVLKVWCTFVGPPDMYDREEKKEMEASTEKND